MLIDWTENKTLSISQQIAHLFLVDNRQVTTIYRSTWCLIFDNHALQYVGRVPFK